MDARRWLRGARGSAGRTAVRAAALGAALLVVYACDRAAASAGRMRVAPLASDDPSVVVVPGGGFLMGSTDGDDDERPVHRVEVAAFAIDRTEVTAGAYDACVAAGACEAAGTDPYCTGGRAGRAEWPINCVAWNDACAYCAFRRARLPTEAEWEYAARGTDGRRYPWGDATPAAQLCWDGPGSDLGAGRRRGTCRVGTHPGGRSAFGLEDMAGNVWEWTADAYSPAYGEPVDADFRVVRGGTWFGYDGADVRASLRYRTRPSARDYGIGFRCARSR